MKKYHLTEYDDRLRDEMVAGSISREEYATLRRKGTHFYVWEGNDTIIGVLTYRESDYPPVALFEYVWVNENFRGDAASSRMVEQLAEQKDFDACIAQIEEELQEYWRSHGFTQVKDDIFCF